MQSVCDADPSVTSAALCALFDLITADPRPYKNMTGAFVNILKQVAERRLPKPYDYHGTPAPFIQVRRGFPNRHVCQTVSLYL